MPVIELDELKDLIPIATVAEHMPRRLDGSPYHPSTALRWALYAMNGRKLRTVKLAGRRFTRPEWLREFLEEFVDK